MSKIDLMTGIVVCKTITTETAHRLMDYVGKCASIHGHSYKWEVTAALDNRDTQSNGISIDFRDLKAAMHEVIYKPFDHALVLSDRDPLMSLPAFSMFFYDTHSKKQKLVAFPHNPTAECFARHAGVHLDSYMEGLGGPPDYHILRVRVWETANSYGQWTADKLGD